MRIGRALVAVVIILSLVLTACGRRTAEQPNYGKLRGGVTHLMAQDARTRVTVPDGWTGTYSRGTQPLYNESSLVGTVSVLPRISQRIEFSQPDEEASIELMVFESLRDAGMQQGIYRKIWSDFPPGGGEESMFTLTPAAGVTAVGSVEMTPPGSDPRAASVVAIVKNERGASFQLVGVFPADNRLFSGTRSQQEMVERLLAFMQVEY